MSQSWRLPATQPLLFKSLKELCHYSLDHRKITLITGTVYVLYLSFRRSWLHPVANHIAYPQHTQKLLGQNFIILTFLRSPTHYSAGGKIVFGLILTVSLPPLPPLQCVCIYSDLSYPVHCTISSAVSTSHRTSVPLSSVASALSEVIILYYCIWFHSVVADLRPYTNCILRFCVIRHCITLPPPFHWRWHFSSHHLIFIVLNYITNQCV